MFPSLASFRNCLASVLFVPVVLAVSVSDSALSLGFSASYLASLHSLGMQFCPVEEADDLDACFLCL